MTCETIRKYFRFFQANRPTYYNFNKQLVIGELAGFIAGVGLAEATSAFTNDEIAISLASGIADYAGSILGFLALFYSDNKLQYPGLSRKDRIVRIMRSALSLWPSVLVADAAYILVRPYAHYLLLVYGLEVGVAATIAHFIAFGVFNGVAILSRSMIDYVKSRRQQGL